MEEIVDFRAEERFSEAAGTRGRPQGPWPGHVGLMATSYKSFSRGPACHFCPAQENLHKVETTTQQFFSVSVAQRWFYWRNFHIWHHRTCAKRLPRFSNSPCRRTDCLRSGGQPMDTWPFLLSLTKSCWRKVLLCALCTVRCRKKCGSWTSASSTWHQSCTKQSMFFFWRRAFIHICVGTFVARNTWERWASQAALWIQACGHPEKIFLFNEKFYWRRLICSCLIGSFSPSLVWRCPVSSFFSIGSCHVSCHTEASC